ncbi:MAG: AAA family ATPase, partial [Pseudonocardiaceae bacterium]
MVVVLDELPYLTGTDPSFDSVLQRVWDHTLEGRPVLFVVVGSDLPTMEAVSSYDRPLYGRVRLERVVLPLNLAEVAEVLGLGAREAVDAYLTVGGFPRVLLSWARGTPRREFV